MPNPEAVFLREERFLELHAEFVPPRSAGAAGEGHVGVALSILTPEGEPRFESKGGWRYAREILPLHFRLPLDSLEAGGYRLRLVLRGEGLAETAFEQPFRILGASQQWDVESRRQEAEAQLLLGSEAFASWRQLGPRDRVAVLDRFWSERDPDPATLQNEAREEFARRCRLAEERYSSSLRPGPLTDRGRILIRYGEPDEIQVEVMPENRMALINAVRALHGRDAIEPGGEWIKSDVVEGILDEESDPDLNRDLGRIGRGNMATLGNDSQAFEVWSYEQDGTPLLPEYRLRLKRIGLTLIFADHTGYGDYELLYRSESFDF